MRSPELPCFWMIGSFTPSSSTRCLSTVSVVSTEVASTCCLIESGIRIVQFASSGVTLHRGTIVSRISRISAARALSAPWMLMPEPSSAAVTAVNVIPFSFIIWPMRLVARSISLFTAAEVSTCSTRCEPP